MLKRQTRGDKAFLITNNIVLGIFLLTVLYPIWIVFVSSISDPELVSAGKVWLMPKGFSLEGYKAIFDYKLIVTGFGNSLILLVGGTLFCTVVTLLGGYPLSRSDLYGRRVILILFTITMYFGGGIIPYFMPYFIHALEWTKQEGFLQECSLDDLSISGLFFGFEVPGYMDCEMKIRDLSLGLLQ